MANAWLEIPLADYEGHMDRVGQAQMLGRVFGRALQTFQPDSAAVLGAAGGNSFEHLADSSVRRTVAVDINRDYLQELEQRFHERIPGLAIGCTDLNDPELDFAPVAFVYAALIFEYVEPAGLLARIRGWLNPGGTLCAHRDPCAGSLRYHLGLATPNADSCRMFVDGQQCFWKDDEDVMFDETYIHYAVKYAIMAALLYAIFA